MPTDFENELVPKNGDVDSVLVCLLNLFDCTVTRFLLYAIEKELFETLGNEGEKTSAKAECKFAVLKHSTRFSFCSKCRADSSLLKTRRHHLSYSPHLTPRLNSQLGGCFFAAALSANII